MILAKTLNDLDASQDGRFDFLRGIPIMVFMWLLERFVWRSHLSIVCRRCQTSSAFVGELFPILELGEYQYVRLLNLHKTSFYFSWWLLCQFSWEQIVPPRTLDFFPVEDRIERMRKRLGSLWENRSPSSHLSQSTGKV